MMGSNAADFIAEALAGCGVRHVFGVGGANIEEPPWTSRVVRIRSRTVAAAGERVQGSQNTERLALASRRRRPVTARK